MLHAARAALGHVAVAALHQVQRFAQQLREQRGGPGRQADATWVGVIQQDTLWAVPGGDTK